MTELRRAINDLVNKFGIGDKVYSIRERSWEDPDKETKQWRIDNPDGNSWDSPMVRRFNECVQILEKFLSSVDNDED